MLMILTFLHDSEAAHLLGMLLTPLHRLDPFNHNQAERRDPGVLLQV